MFQTQSKINIPINNPLTGKEINEALSNVKDYRGLVIKFQLDKEWFKNAKDGFYVINYGQLFEGTHWVAMELRGKNILYFSSLGDKPLKIFDTIKYKVIYNNYKFQSNYSANCGLWCIVFIRWMNSGRGFKEFSDLFYPHDSEKLLLNNDRKMISLYQNHI